MISRSFRTLGLGALLALVGLSSVAQAQNPLFLVSGGALGLASPAGNTLLVQAPITIQNTSSIVQTFTLSSNTATSTPSWLQFSPFTQTTPVGTTLANQQIQPGAQLTYYVYANPANLPAGPNPAQIYVDTNTSSGPSRQTIAVTFTIGGAGTGGGVTANPQQLNFLYRPGSTTAPNALPITLTGVTNPSVVTSITYDAANPNGTQFLSVASQLGSTTPTFSASLQNFSGLVVGTYRATINFNVNGTNVPVQVQLVVSTQPQLILSPAQLTFNFVPGVAAAQTQFVQLTAEAAAGAPVVAAAPTVTQPVGSTSAINAIILSSGTAGQITTNAPGVMSVTVSPSGLTPGTTATGTIQIATTGAAATSFSIPVTINVAAQSSPIITLPTNLLSFSYQTNIPGQSQGFQPQQVAVGTTVGGTTVNYTVTSDSPWLTVSQSGPTAPGTATVGINVSGLGNGLYTGQLTFTSPGPNGTSAAQRLQVNLRISDQPLLNVATQIVNFTYPIPAGQTGAVDLPVTSSNPNVQLTYQASTSVGFPALRVAGTAGQTQVTPSSVRVSFDPSQLNTASGAVNLGFVQIQPTAGSTAPPVVVPVQIFVTSSSALVAGPATSFPLTLRQSVGGSSTATAQFTVSTQGGPVNFTVQTRTNTGSNFLVANPTSGVITTVSPQQTITVSLAAGLVPTVAGTYFGSVDVIATDDPNNRQTVPVQLIVSSPITITVDKPSLTFAYTTGASAPAGQVLQVSTQGGTAPIAVSATSTGGSNNWLQVSPTTLNGPFPQNVTATISPAGLPAGQYTGSVRIALADGSGTPVSVPVTLNVTAVPIGQIQSVLNAATNQPGAVAPGQIVAIKGLDLGPVTPAGTQLTTVAGQQYVTTTLSGVQVLFDGIAAPLTYVSQAQVNAVVPYAVRGRATTNLQISNQGVLSNVLALRVENLSPGIFTANSQGVGPAAALNQDFSSNTTTGEARGRAVILYATGEGALNIPGGGTTGLVTPNTTPFTLPQVTPITATIGGLPATVLFAGEAPGFVSGALQVNVQIPAGVGSGPQTVVLTLGTAQTQAGVTINVQ